MELEEHYAALLGISSPWEIYRVDLKLEEQRVDIVIEYTDDEGLCPECGACCPKYDERKERTWRHLDTMQFSHLFSLRSTKGSMQDPWRQNRLHPLGRKE